MMNPDAETTELDVDRYGVWVASGPVDVEDNEEDFAITDLNGGASATPEDVADLDLPEEDFSIGDGLDMEIDADISDDLTTEDLSLTADAESSDASSADTSSAYSLEEDDSPLVLDDDLEFDDEATAPDVSSPDVSSPDASSAYSLEGDDSPLSLDDDLEFDDGDLPPQEPVLVEPEFGGDGDSVRPPVFEEVQDIDTGNDPEAVEDEPLELMLDDIEDDEGISPVEPVSDGAFLDSVPQPEDEDEDFEIAFDESLDEEFDDETFSVGVEETEETEEGEREDDVESPDGGRDDLPEPDVSDAEALVAAQKDATTEPDYSEFTAELDTAEIDAGIKDELGEAPPDLSAAPDDAKLDVSFGSDEDAIEDTYEAPSARIVDEDEVEDLPLDSLLDQNVSEDIAGSSISAGLEEPIEIEEQPVGGRGADEDEDYDASLDEDDESFDAFGGAGDATGGSDEGADFDSFEFSDDEYASSDESEEAFDLSELESEDQPIADDSEGYSVEVLPGAHASSDDVEELATDMDADDLPELSADDEDSDEEGAGQDHDFTPDSQQLEIVAPTPSEKIAPAEEEYLLQEAEDFDDVRAVEEELSRPIDDGDSEVAGMTEESASVLRTIEGELEEIRSELVGLRRELAFLRSAPSPAEHDAPGVRAPVPDEETTGGAPAAGLSEEEPSPQREPDETPDFDVTSDDDAAMDLQTDEEDDAHGGFFEDDDEDETIALTGDELDNILNTAEFVEEEGEPSEVDDLDLDVPVAPGAGTIPEVVGSSDLSDDEQPGAASVALGDDETAFGDGAVLEDDTVFEDDAVTEGEEIGSPDDIDDDEYFPPSTVIEPSDYEDDEIVPMDGSASPVIDDDQVAIAESGEEPADDDGDEWVDDEIGTSTATAGIDEEPSGDDAPIGDEEPIEEIVLDDLADEPDDEVSLPNDSSVVGDEVNMEVIESMDVDREIGDIEGLDEPSDEDEPGTFYRGEDLDEVDVAAAAETASTDSMGLDDDGWTDEDLSAGPQVVEAEADASEPVTPVQDQSASQAAPRRSSVDQLPDDLRDEIKSVLQYMDQLLEALPDEKIQEFAQSEHFTVYKRLFDELGI